MRRYLIACQTYAQTVTGRFCLALCGCCLFVAFSVMPSVARDSGLTGVESGGFGWDIVRELDMQQYGLEKANAPSTTAARPNALALKDSSEFANFVDSFFQQAIAEGSIPGASISVVKDGSLLFSKGYGYADLEAQTPVAADRTLFRVASLSKLFTATATMQLYEQGKLDLSDDINQYLDFSVNNPYDTPVNFAHLMTHTDGTTKRRIGLAAPTAKQMQPLGNYLRDHLPAIIYPPGKLYSYSSHSIALLGYLVERISTLPFADYIEQRILQPLAMQRTTFLQPPPPELANDLAVGYQKVKQNFEPVPYLYLNIAPAAALQTTATDMAHFMIAHLQSGRYQQQQILQPTTVQLMHQTHFAHDPRLPGTGYGFREQYINGIRTVGHLGSLRGYSSALSLMPEQNIGIFIVTNSFNGIHGKFLTQFFDRYFPSSPTEAITEPQVDIDPSVFTGNYRDLEYPRRTMTKLSGLFQLVRIRPYEQGRLQAQTPALLFRNSTESRVLTPLTPFLFQQADGETLTVFRSGEPGSMRYAFNLMFAKIGAYEWVPWYGSVVFQLSVLLFCTVFFMTAAASWVIRPVVNHLRLWLSQASLPNTSFQSALRFKDLSWPYRAAGIAGLLNLVFLVGLPLKLWLMGVWRLAYGVPLTVVALLCIPLITALLAVFLLFGLASGYWQGGTVQRLHYGLVTLSAIAFIPFLHYWNLLGFKF